MKKPAARILLEPLTAAHAVELFPLLTDPAIYTYIADRPPASLSALAARYCWLESRHSPDGSQQWLNWVIRRIDDGQTIGFVQATVHAGKTADLAFVLAPPFWGLGLAHEATAAVLSMLFSQFGTASVFATVDRRNVRSSTLLSRLGFEVVPSASYPHGTVAASDDVFLLRNAAPSP